MIAAAVAFTTLPLLVLRRLTLWRYIAADVATYLFAALVWRQVEGVDPRLAAVAFFAAKLAMFCLFVARGEHVRWSATRAALIALVVYSLLVPAMQRTPIDGDEPYYLLITESLVQDRDLDLANQYAGQSRSQTQRADLSPQLGDRVGSGGEQYSRLEPFLPALLVPGYLLAGRSGAIATIVLFAALLIRSSLRWFEDEGIDEATVRGVFPFLAFGPPVLFFAARIWPEVPAALFFVEALRGVRARRAKKWFPAVVLLSALKLRFALIAAVLVIRRRAAIVALITVVLIAGAATKSFGLAGSPLTYANGFFGLLLDGAAGIAFQAPFYLLALLAFVRWRSMPEGFRLGVVSSLLYLVLLIPRSEWHGGWSPPLRYIVVLMPVLALGVASVWSRVSAPLIALTGVWTAGVAVHGVAFPWRLFHIANGENVIGEALSRMYGSDFSRMFPSFIRVNGAALIGIGVLAALLVLAAISSTRDTRVAPLFFAVACVALAWFFVQGRKPGRVVHFEDAHVVKNGGELYPPEFTVARFNFRGGWLLHGGNSVTFLARQGPAAIHYASREPSTIGIGSRTYRLAPTADQYHSVPVTIEQEGLVELRCLAGSVNLDRIE